MRARLSAWLVIFGTLIFEALVFETPALADAGKAPPFPRVGDLDVSLDLTAAVFVGAGFNASALVLALLPTFGLAFGLAFDGGLRGLFFLVNAFDDNRFAPTPFPDLSLLPATDTLLLTKDDCSAYMLLSNKSSHAGLKLFTSRFLHIVCF
ncbi:MAG: hypothetical protein GX589_03125 [Deltaproteobacteria bacterium]|nr:hypothetical protein [Deltaproteobacteria bacterium]